MRQKWVILIWVAFFWGGGISAAWAQDRSPLIVVIGPDSMPVPEAELSWGSKGVKRQKALPADSTGAIRLPTDWKRISRFTLFKAGFSPQFLTPAELLAAEFRLHLSRQQYQLEEVVFTANKAREQRDDIPHQIAVVSRAQIELGNPQTSADLLQQQGGVFVQRSQGGGGSPNLRGFEANKVLLVIDGVRMNNAIYRSGHLQNVITIDPAVIDRAEILFGPGSVIYGSDALGGVMHLYTKKPQLGTATQKKIQGHTALRGSSANGEVSLHADLNIGSTRWASLSSLSLTRFGDLRAGGWRPRYPEFGLRDSLVKRIDDQDVIVLQADPNFQSPTGYQQVDALQKFLFVPRSGQAHQLNLQFSNSTDVPRYDRLTQLREGRLRYAEWFYGPQTRGLASYQFIHEKKGSWYDQLTLTSAYQHIRESRHSRTRGDDWRSNRQEIVNVFSLNLDAQLERPTGHEWAYGVEHTQNWVSSGAEAVHIITGETSALDTRYPDGGTHLTTAAAYLTHRWEPNPRMTLTSGLRYSFIRLQAQFEDRTFFPFDFDEILQQNQALSGNLGWVWKLPAGWRLSTLASTGFRAPNLDDVAKVFDSQPGTVVIPNPDLAAEYTYNGELSVQKRWLERGLVSLTGFYTWYDNAIVVRPSSLNGEQQILYDGVMSEVLANVNAQQAWISGFNLSVRWQYRVWQAYHQLTFTYGNAVSDDTVVPMDHIPPLFGQGGIRFMKSRWEGDVFIAYQAAKPLDRYSPRDVNNLFFATEDGSPAWWTLNLKGSFLVRPQVRIQAGIENILDLHYRSYSSRISAPGRNVYLAVRSAF